LSTDYSGFHRFKNNQFEAVRYKTHCAGLLIQRIVGDPMNQLLVMMIALLLGVMLVPCVSLALEIEPLWTADVDSM
jgi:hypothetical protein